MELEADLATALGGSSVKKLLTLSEGGASEVEVAVNGLDVNGKPVVGRVRAFEAEPFSSVRARSARACSRRCSKTVWWDTLGAEAFQDAVPAAASRAWPARCDVGAAKATKAPSRTTTTSPSSIFSLRVIFSSSSSDARSAASRSKAAHRSRAEFTLNR